MSLFSETVEPKQSQTSKQGSKPGTNQHYLNWIAIMLTLSCVLLCDPLDCSPPGSSVHGIFQGKNTVVGSHFLLQGIFPTQGPNLGLLCLLL